MGPYAGQIAALLTAGCWSINSVLYTLAGRRVGSRSVNISRLWIAWLAMVALHLAFFGSPWPMAAGSSRLMWLGVSGLIGFALGDAVLFEAFLRLGPRLAMLIMTLWPIFATLMAWAFLGERLPIEKLLAMGMALGGIACVVADKASSVAGEKHTGLFTGVLLAIGGALGQSTGFILSRFGLEGGFHPVSANLIRISAGTLSLTLWMLLRGELKTQLSKLSDRRAFFFILAGSIAGPVTGVVLSLYAQAHAPQGVVATLMSQSPIILLPVGAIFFGERITWRAIVGTCVTLAGITAMFLGSSLKGVGR